jgi:hypothetical protein
VTKDADPKLWALAPVSGRYYSNPADEPPATFDYYIGPTGSDSNPGTEAEPWAITAINTKRATYAGQRLGLLDGTYDISGLSGYSGSNVRLVVPPGSEGSPTVVQAVNARMAILDGGGIGSSENAAIGSEETTAAHIEILNLVVQNCRKHSILFAHTNNNASNQGEGLRIEGNEVKEQHQTVGTDFAPAILLNGFDAPIVRNNWVHDVTSTENAAASAGVEAYACRGMILEVNTLGPNLYYGYYDKYGSNGVEMQGTEVRRNYIYGCDVALGGFDNKPQTAPAPDEGPYIPYYIEHNVIDSCGAALTNAGSFSADCKVICRNNTLYNTSGDLSGFNLHCRMADREPSFYNNIIFNQGTWVEWRAVTGSLDGSTLAIEVFDYNCYGPSSFAAQYLDVVGYPWTTSNYTVVTSLATWRTLTGQEAGSFVDDPEFTLTGTDAERFQLGPSSPCRDAGRVGGVSGGAAVHMGAWTAGITQIGADFAEAA